MAQKKQDNDSLSRQSLHAKSLTKGSFQDLLPGILDEITLYNITPKLSWRDLYLLSTVSRAWCHANRSRRIYSARAHQDCLETLVLIDYSHLKVLEYLSSSEERRPVRSEGKFSTTEPRCGRRAGVTSMSGNGIGLYSMRDNSYYKLPLIHTEGLLGTCSFVSLEGKVYALGMLPDARKVCVLDLTGQGQWRPCAPMVKARTNIECAVLGGKIFVFEGSFRLGGEVYDPKENTWSEIGWTTISLRFPHHVEIVGEEFAVHDGISFIRNVLIESPGHVLAPACARQRFILHLRGLIYEQPEGVWKVRESKWMQLRETPNFFMKQGKLHRMRRWRGSNQYRIEVHNASENCWTNLHSFTFDAIGFECSFVKLAALLAVNDELLTVVSWCNTHGRTGFCLLQSKGLGSLTEEISWHKEVEVNLKMNGPLKSCFLLSSICMCPVSL